MARGALPDSHPQNLGMPGMHGTVAAVGALQSSDLLIALGTRFDDRVTGQLSTFAPNAKVIHADIDPAEISKNRRADVPIVGDAKEVIAELVVAIQAELAAGRTFDIAGWWSELDHWLEKYPLGYEAAQRRDARPAVRHRAPRPDRRAGRAVRRRRRPAPDVGRAVRAVREAGHVDQLRRPGHHGLRGSRRDGRQGRAPRRRPCGPSTATAASR